MVFYGEVLSQIFIVLLSQRRARLAWSEFLNRSPERYKIRLHELPENCCKGMEEEISAILHAKD